MSRYLQPLDDGLTARDSGQWVIEKLDYVNRYIGVFETAMRKKWANRHYLDLFSGPGKCVIRKTGMVHLGSPLLALTTKHPFTKYVFVDSQPENISALKTRCEASPLIDTVTFLQTDANSVVSDIVATIQEIPSLNLAFLDPEGLELAWGTIETLARVERMDLIIHYSQMGLNRLMPIAIETGPMNNVDSFFGDIGWREIYRSYREKQESFLHRNLMDYYKSKLQGLGYRETYRDDEVGAEPLILNEKGAPLYRLLFASKHPLGLEFWQKITSKNVYGQTRMF